jgi:hypothetical protein
MCKCTNDAQTQELISNTFNLNRFDGKHFTPKGQVTGSSPVGITIFPFIVNVLWISVLSKSAKNRPKSHAQMMHKIVSLSLRC